MFFFRSKYKSLFVVVFLLSSLSLNLLSTGLALAELDPEPATYQDPPPGPAFQPNLINLPSAPAQQKFGIAAHPWWLDVFLDQFIAYYKDLKITSVRLPFNWKDMEPGRGVYQWSLTDRLLNRLNDEGFEVIAEFVTVPVWASVNQAECAASDLQCDPDPRYTADMNRAAQAAVKRYPFIRYWEFWNEPDEWPHMGQNDIAKYTLWLRAFYEGAKKADPTVLVAATSLSGPAYTDWLYAYCDATFHFRPWDAIGYHPYVEHIPDPYSGTIFGIRKNRIDQLRQLMVSHGDQNKPIWLTEIGWGLSPQVQSIFLTDSFNFLAKRPYVTIVNVHMLHDWQHENFGLLRIKQDVLYKRPLAATDQFEPKQPYYDTFKNYEKRPLPPRPVATPDLLVFPQTQHTVRDVFKKAWERGGLALFGYPKTGQFYERNPSDGQYYLVQYFERVRMEYHPDNQGTPYEVLFGLLGTQLLTRRGWFDANGSLVDSRVMPESKPAKPARNQQWFEETHHTLSGLFLAEWQKQGGLSIVGLPLTRVFDELNPDDGQTYQVQYFQRARAELHPAANGQPPYVLFGLLGNEVLRTQSRLLPNNGVDFSSYYNPALSEFY